ncbi:MAG: hypothetical protein LBK03_01485 [Bacteroidales bacterium]|jgi:hypothetical protein|nr:hypothetical protein [Bacteroidales bacterium]
MQAKYENNNYSLSLIYYFALGQSITNSDYNLILLLDDGSTIEAPCLQNIPSVSSKGVGIIVYTYNFGISETNFVKLLESDITDIRMTAAINPVEFSIDKKVKTREFFKCIDRNK